MEEFNVNICGRASVLKSTRLPLERFESRMLAEQMAFEKENAEKMLKKLIMEQPFFKNEQTKMDLLRSSASAPWAKGWRSHMAHNAWRLHNEA